MLRKIKKYIRIIQDTIRGYLYKINFIKYQKWCKKNNQKEYILFAVPIHGNIGDQAITFSEEKFLSDLQIKFFQVATYDEKRIFNFIKNRLNNDAIILIHGGGFMGNQWDGEEKFIRKIITNYSNNKIVVFPQTIFYKENEDGKIKLEEAKKIYNSHSNLHICAREEKSYNFMKDVFPNVHIMLVPDMVLYLNKYESNVQKNSALVCLRNDPERKITDSDAQKITNILQENYNKITYTDTVISKRVYKKQRKNVVFGKIMEFAKSEIVITDRLHGMVFAAIAQTPCIVFENYNHKVRGVYKWIKHLDYIKCLKSTDDLSTIIQELKNKKCEYDCVDKNKYNELIKELKD